MFLLSPYFWLALAGMFVIGWFSGCTHEHKNVAKVEAAWEADKAIRLATLKRIDAERKAAVELAHAEAAERARKDKAAFVALQSRTNDLAAELRRVSIELAVVKRLRDAISTANAEAPGTPAGAAEDPAAATAPVSGLALVNWFNQVARFYKECRDEVIAWNAFWDKQMAVE